MNKVPFSKPPLFLSEQVNLLRQRGMQILNQSFAEQTLLRLNYYRFSGYALHFEIFHKRERTHLFAPGTNFEQVVELYEFDTRLCALLFRYIEPVEVAFRAAVCYELSTITNNPHWYLEKARYNVRFNFDRFLQDCQREYDRSDEVFIQSYRMRYSSPDLPPAWMMSEILSIGTWSRLFKDIIDTEAKKAVAGHFNVKSVYLESWIHSLSVLRNLCAHHCRIWNRSFTIRPSLTKSMQRNLHNNAKLSAQIAVLSELLKPLGKEAEFQKDWETLLQEFPNVPPGRMGFYKR